MAQVSRETRSKAGGSIIITCPVAATIRTLFAHSPDGPVSYLGCPYSFSQSNGQVYHPREFNFIQVATAQAPSCISAGRCTPIDLEPPVSFDHASQGSDRSCGEQRLALGTRCDHWNDESTRHIDKNGATATRAGLSINSPPSGVLRFEWSP